MLRASLFFVRASQVESYLDCDLSPLSVPPPHNSFIVAGADGSWEEASSLPSTAQPGSVLLPDGALAL